MQKIALALSLIATIFFSCKNKATKDTLTIHGTIKNFIAGKVYLDQLYFNGQEPVAIDSSSIDKDKFTLSSSAAEEGLYRIRLAGQPNGFMFINDNNNINFIADSADLSLNGPSFNTAANASLKKFIGIMDSLQKDLITSNTTLKNLQEKGVQQTDSAFITAINIFESTKEKIATFCFQYGDTTQSPVLGIFTITTAPVTVEKLEIPLDNLAKRFPTHAGATRIAAFAKQKIAETKKQMQSSNKTELTIGSMAPEITMPDTEGKPFSLSALKGKYVLIDFWASWCGPCRAENPNVVTAYNQFKDKNFTILGVSLDENKASWIKAIQQDKLVWKQVSDLQFWNSAAVSLYGFTGIPFNVLVDPEGKIIAMDLRGETLTEKLTEVLNK